MSSLNHLLSRDLIDCSPSSSFDVVNQHDAVSSDSRMKLNSRRCSIPDCRKTVKRGGRCISHGGGNRCAIGGCTTNVVSRGLCVAHGGGKRCQTPECTKSAQSGGFCWVHGGGKKCGYHGCPKRAQSGGACIAHGGGKRCRIDACNKVVQYDGLCAGHGGYRRCVFKNCEKRAMANDYCQQHGGSSVCLFKHCCKRAVRGGMCPEHKAEASLFAVSASGLSTSSQSFDEGRQCRVDKRATTATRITQWPSRISSHEVTSNSPQETTTNTDQRFQLDEDVSPRAPPPVRSSTRLQNGIPRGDSPIAPGFSAFLKADDKFQSLSTEKKKVKSSTERYVRRQHQPLQKEHNVYPVLPSIQALQNYHSQGTSDIEKIRPCVYWNRCP